VVDAMSSGENVCGVDERSSTELAVIPVDTNDPWPLVLVGSPTATDL